MTESSWESLLFLYQDIYKRLSSILARNTGGRFLFLLKNGEK